MMSCAYKPSLVSQLLAPSIISSSKDRFKFPFRRDFEASDSSKFWHSQACSLRFIILFKNLLIALETYDVDHDKCQ